MTDELEEPTLPTWVLCEVCSADGVEVEHDGPCPFPPPLPETEGVRWD